MRAYGQKCYNSFDYFIYFSLSSQHISLSICNIALSLSPLWSPSLRCSLFLSHFHFFISLTLFLSLCISVLSPQIQPISAPLSLSLSLFLSLSLSLSFPVTKKKAIPIWSIACRLKLANLNLCSPIWSSACLGAIADLCSSSSKLSPPMVGWVWSLIDLLGWGFVEDFESFFKKKFGWDFWIWNLLEDPVIVVVVYGGGCSCGCCCGGGCSGGCWTQWRLPLAVHLYICWVFGKYIILMGRKYYFNI